MTTIDTRRPQDALGVIYWLAVGLLGLLTLYASVYSASISYLLIPTDLVFVAAWWPGIRYPGAGLVLFGVYPALFFTGRVLVRIINPMRVCSEVTIRGVPSPTGETHDCVPNLIGMISVGPRLWTVAFLRWCCCTVRLDRGTLEEYSPKLVDGEISCAPPSWVNVRQHFC